MQIPNAVGTLANSVLPATPTQGALPSQTGENADSVSFAPVEETSATANSNRTPEERPNQQAEQAVTENASRSKSESSQSTADQSSDQQAERQAADERVTEQRVEAQQRQDQQIIRQLSQRDAEVRAHEQAHAAVGGQYAGSANFSYERGPDGVNYAVGGEVPIDVSVISGDPQATLEKMLVVQRAALAPAEPSSQDRRVAALAANQANQARAEILSESRTASSSDSADEAANDDSRISASRAKEEAEQKDKDAEKKQESAQADLAEQFKGFNARISRINDLLQEINQTGSAREAGALLDAVV